MVPLIEGDYAPAYWESREEVAVARGVFRRRFVRLVSRKEAVDVIAIADGDVAWELCHALRRDQIE